MPALDERPASHSQASLLQSFNWAFEGLVWAFRHQRNLRIHFVVAIVVLVGSLFFSLSRLELIAVFGAITLVLVAEMVNTALEAAIDLATDSFDPRAKIAKDMGAAAVLVAAANSVLVGYFVFADKAARLSVNVLSTVRRSPAYLTFVTLVLVILLVVIVKARLGRGRVFSGGLPSGHAAVAFAAWTGLTFATAQTDSGVLVSTVTFFMALLTAQSRVQSGIHTPVEVLLGGILGVLVATLVFQLLS